nr:reverse transcriptase domain-containing protein [Tanacetum cinerariifolium]
MIFHIDSTMKHSYSNDDMCFSIDVISEILEEDFDALLDEGSKILHSVEGTILEEKLFAECDEFLAMTADENSESNSDEDEPKFEKIIINTDQKIKTSLEEPPPDLELKHLLDNLEYDLVQSYVDEDVVSFVSEGKQLDFVSMNSAPSWSLPSTSGSMEVGINNKVDHVVFSWPYGDILRLRSGSKAADAATRVGLEGKLVSVNGQHETYEETSLSSRSLNFLSLNTKDLDSSEIMQELQDLSDSFEQVVAFLGQAGIGAARVGSAQSTTTTNKSLPRGQGDEIGSKAMIGDLLLGDDAIIGCKWKIGAGILEGL